MSPTTSPNLVASRYYRQASVNIRPQLHLSETTALLKAKRFLENAAREIDERHARMNVVERRLDRIYRKPLNRFRALCKDPSMADVTQILHDTGKELALMRLFHTHDRVNRRSYFYLVRYAVTNKGLKGDPLRQPVDIAISAHSLARMLERCSVDLRLDMRAIRMLLMRLLLKALEAQFDEKGKARIGLEQFPDMVFVCCRHRWLTDPREMPAHFTIVTYFEK